jgi:hypothetical protein
LCNLRGTIFAAPLNHYDCLIAQQLLQPG